MGRGGAGERAGPGPGPGAGPEAGLGAGLGRQVVLAVGDAVTDAVVRLAPGGLARLGLRAGSCAAMDAAAERRLLGELGGERGADVPGGSAANVAKGLARLGRPTRLLSAVGDDEVGPRYRAALADLGVDVGEVAEVRGARSPICYCLVAPEYAGERTMRTFLGDCSVAKRPPAPGCLRDVALVHLEGYTFYTAGFPEAVASQARSEGARVSLDLGSVELVERAGAAIAALLRGGGVDVLFSNEEEACALAQRCLSEEGGGPRPPPMDAESALDALSGLAETVVVTAGARGCFVRGSGGVRAEAEAGPTVQVLDTVGAGDSFASGFLRAHLAGASLRLAARCGCLCGTQAVQVAGANIGGAEWAALKSRIDSLLCSEGGGA